MQLPNSQRAVVERRKVVEYLLNRAHPDGAGKAAFFARFGFGPQEWERFAEALRRHGRGCSVTKTVESAYGTRYSVDGLLETPGGRRPTIRTVWIVARGERNPRLITAHPL